MSKVVHLRHLRLHATSLQFLDRALCGIGSVEIDETVTLALIGRLVHDRLCRDDLTITLA